MIVSGDEVLRTQRGNNNAYCQDNAISWFDWKLVEKNAEHLRFMQSLVEFRKAQPTVRRDSFLTGSPATNGELADVSWYNPSGKPMDWDTPTQGLVCVFGTAGIDDPLARPVMLLMHSGTDTQEFIVPAAVKHLPWRQFINTAAEMPADIYPTINGPKLPAHGKLSLVHHTLLCYVA